MALGDIVLDIVVAAGAAVESGTDVPGTIRFRAGGSAANTARTFAGLGGEAAFVGAVGDDAWGRRLVAALRADGVRVRPARAAGPSARLVALVGPRGERSFITQRGAADRLAPADLREGWFRLADVLHLPAYSLVSSPLCDAALLAVEYSRRAGALVSVDLASRRPLLELGRAAARGRIASVGPDIVFANADEAAAMGGTDRLLELAPVVVVKHGAGGCRVTWRSDDASGALRIDIATAALDASDTTGAGDAFDAGFLHALALAGGRDAMRRAPLLRRAALTGHRAAAGLLTRPRPELAL